MMFHTLLIVLLASAPAQDDTETLRKALKESVARRDSDDPNEKQEKTLLSRISWIDDRGIIVALGSNHGAIVGLRLKVRRGRKTVGKITLTEVSKIHSWGKPTGDSKQEDFQKSDSVESIGARPGELIRYFLTVGPIDPETTSRVAQLVLLLDDEDADVRASAVDELIRTGYPAYQHLLDLRPMSFSAEPRARITFAIEILSSLQSTTEEHELDHDLTTLIALLSHKKSSIRNKAAKRLQSILQDVPPFNLKEQGHRQQANDSDEAASEWYVKWQKQYGSGLRWDEDKQRYRYEP